MQHFVRFLLVLAVVALVAPAAPEAHFKLVEPAPWIVENERGDPQKTGPCGGSNADWGTPSGIVTEVAGGSLLPLKILETIYHPGHYRVALAVNTPLELPPDPETRTRPSHRGEWDRPWSVSAMIEVPPQPPVLADGLFMHYTREPTPIEFETEVRVPNVNCDRCTLQVIQWMAEHAYNNPGAYSYHHCAHLKITADESQPLDEGWPAQHSATDQ